MQPSAERCRAEIHECIKANRKIACTAAIHNHPINPEYLVLGSLPQANLATEQVFQCACLGHGPCRRNSGAGASPTVHQGLLCPLPRTRKKCQSERNRRASGRDAVIDISGGVA